MTAASPAPRRFGLLAIRVSAAGLAGLALSACVQLPEGPTTCTDQEMRSDSWPYCAPAEPAGGGIPADDPIDPTGRRF